MDGSSSSKGIGSFFRIESLGNDMVYGNEPLAVEEWLKKSTKKKLKKIIC